LREIAEDFDTCLRSGSVILLARPASEAAPLELRKT
jgi:hypothetical protein